MDVSINTNSTSDHFMSLTNDRKNSHYPFLIPESNNLPSLPQKQIFKHNYSNESHIPNHKPPPTYGLTSSQEKLVTTCIKLIPDFNVIVIKGDAGSGKYIAASEIFRRLDATVEVFDLCELARRTNNEMSNQHVIDYLDYLLLRLSDRMDDNELHTPSMPTCPVWAPLTPTKRRKLNDNHPFTKFSQLSLDNDLSTCSRKSLGIIYFRHYNRIADVLTDCTAKLRFLLPLILKTFAESMPNNIRIVITTHGCLLPEGLHWCTELQTTRNDMEHILLPFCQSGTISNDQLHQIMKISNTIPVGRMLYCMRYAIAMSRNDKHSSNELNDDSMVPTETSDFIECYKKALSRFSGSTVDIDKDVPRPEPEDDLVGVEEIMDEIMTSIINPMRLCIPGIHIKKGLLLCGPPGTGKTSLGRWLAHQIKGKFYLIGGEVGINGSILIDTFETTVRKARDNAPAVIFIDDGDVLFDHDDTYRAFLTILDGIETNKRNDVCVILTCMNMRKVPASLIRGGRLEMALFTRLPDRKKIQTILERSLNKMYGILNDYDNVLSLAISKYINLEFITHLAHKMCGWNCADIHRCVNDVSRLIISNKGTNLVMLFDICIKQIREQYTLCGHCESTNIDERPYDSYIS